LPPPSSCETIRGLIISGFQPRSHGPTLPPLPMFARLCENSAPRSPTAVSLDLDLTVTPSFLTVILDADAAQLTLLLEHCTDESE